MAAGSKKVIIAALIGNGLIAITKFIAAVFTGSAAMLAEGVHSVVDTGNQVLLLIGLKRAGLPPDKEHPFGHGKEIYFWGFVVAILLFALGSGISIYKGISHLQHPASISSFLPNYIVLGLALVFEGAAWWFAWREFNKRRGKYSILEAVKRGKDPNLFVVLFEDTAAMLGLLTAAGGLALVQITGNPLYDGAASVTIGIILGLTAIWLAIETKGLLIGEPAHPEVIDGIRETIAASRLVQQVNEVATLHMGPEFILATVSAGFDPEATVAQLQDEVAEINRRIKQRFPEVKRIFIEGESGETARRERQDYYAGQAL